MIPRLSVLDGGEECRIVLLEDDDNALDDDEEEMDLEMVLKLL
jgi:hypothetical protein